MGVQLREIVPSREIDLSMLKGKKIAIDAFNTLYQFITTIRQRDGTPLMDSKGRITSHLSGLFYRTIKLVEAGIRPVYVFDGKPPSFKLVLEEREKRKEEAEEKLKEAIEKGDFVSASVYAKQAARLEPYMVEEAKKLLTYMGIPWIQAPSEGEAQAAYMAAKGDVDASASQDYDSLLFGSPVLIRNLAITGKRKLPRKDIYVEVKPEEIILKEVLDNLKITREQLIMLAMLVGTDFNPGGIKGIGPKKALELVKAFPKPELLFSKVKWNPEWPRPEEILGFFLDPPVNEDYVLKWKEPDVDAVLSFMVDEHDFSYDRVKKALDSLKKAVTGGTQSTLSKWF